MNKRLVIVFISFIIFISALLTVKYIFKNKLSIPETETAYITFVYDDKNIHNKLTKSEMIEIRNMVNDSEYFYDEGMSCGFTEHISITFEDTFFDCTVCVACDGCGILKIGKKAVNITPKERIRINEIFEKYGGFFPAI